MQNWHQLLELAQITEQERQQAALMSAERRRQRRSSAVRNARGWITRIRDHS
jgi:hypothetical protein